MLRLTGSIAIAISFVKELDELMTQLGSLDISAG